MLLFFVIPIFGSCSRPFEISRKIRSILPKEDIRIIFVDDNPQKKKDDFREKKSYKFSELGEHTFFINSGGVGQHKAIIYGIRYIEQNFQNLLNLTSDKSMPDNQSLENSIFIVMDGDLSYDPNYILIFLDKIRNSDLVLGLSEKKYGFPRKIFTLLFYYLIYCLIYMFLVLRGGKFKDIPSWIFEPQNLSRITTFVAFKPKLLISCFNLNIKNFLVHLVFSAIRNNAKIDFVFLKKNFASCSSYTFSKLIKLSFETILDIISIIWSI